ncbi:MAG TPA: type II toxin-antitoxin system HicA family toxin [Bacteroidia bacterium]|nr:type II toxin-antitoxin system HicA family toxin [Bacteroidia bacterium]
MKSREFIRELSRHGWYVVRQTGSHIILKHDLKPNKLSVPYHGSKEIGKGLERKIRKNAGI